MKTFLTCYPKRGNLDESHMWHVGALPEQTKPFCGIGKCLLFLLQLKLKKCEHGVSKGKLAHI